LRPQGFPPELRLRTQADFDRVFATKVRAADSQLRLFAARNGGTESRFGMVVSRRLGNSVVRHRLKRQLREAFRRQRDTLPKGLDLVVIPQGGRNATMPDYEASLKKLAGRLAARLAEASSP
jgi:ribonuclease P protein component